MEMEDNNTISALKKWYGFDMKVVLESVLVGGLVGLVIVLFRMCLSSADAIRTQFYLNSEKHSIIEWVCWVLVLLAAGYILHRWIKAAPMASGSGIPQIKGFLLRQIQLNWVKDLFVKFFGGLLSLGAGLSLGREGPSVQMGATIGLGFSRLLKRFKTEEKYLVTAGASAGLAAAFNAPLAGVIFALEELHKNFSSRLLISAMAASVTADFVASNFFGLKPIFDFKDIAVIDLKQYGYIIVLGIVVGILGVGFNTALLFVKRMMDTLKAKKKSVISYVGVLLSLIVGLTVPELLGGGHALIDALTTQDYLFIGLFLLFLGKLTFTVVSYGSNVPGGIFLPILVLGAIVGRAFGAALVKGLQVDSVYLMNYLILGMAGFFTAVIKAPITGSVLITEMTGSFHHLLPLIIISLVAYLVADLLRSKPIYESLLERVLENHQGNWLKNDSKDKVIIEIPITFGAEIEHKRIKDIECPKHCLFVGIKRGETEIIPKGNDKLYVGDILIAIVDEKDVMASKLKLLKLAGNL